MKKFEKGQIGYKERESTLVLQHEQTKILTFKYSRKDFVNLNPITEHLTASVGHFFKQGPNLCRSLDSANLSADKPAILNDGGMELQFRGCVFAGEFVI
jgi:hypothetical protein